ncbi:hypothetical protein B0O80DRAFT_441399 [Mortierella sp. GBAus27b]|nr:hypothetical protein B0O80DRAFT_441399 [Mortierella sp. GBAus27b]
MLPNLPPAVPPTTPRTEAIQWAVVRVTNIPWDISLHDMLSFVSGVPHPPEHLLPQNVHILMDRATGKTFNSAFIELAVTPQQARIVVQSRHQKILKGRMVTVEVSSQDELMRSVFPKWPGEFVDGEPVIPGEQLISLKTGPDTSDLPDEYLDMNISVDSDKDIPGSGSTYQTFGGLPDSSLFPKMSLLSMPVKTANGTISGSSSTNSISAGPGAVGKIQSPAITPAFVSRDEINALLVVCRNYKLHFSRKCAERPFENIISILVKYPWHQPHRVLPLHRDHIFELLKLSIESLRLHLSKENNTIDPTLLTRIVRSAILSPAFTERQKAMVLHVAGCSCPEDIVGWMTPPGPVESETAKDTSETDSQEDGSQDDTDRDSQETVRPSPRLKEVDTQIEGLAISDEIHMSPCLVELPNSPQLVKDGDQAMPPGGTSAPNIVPSPPVDTDHDLAQSLKSSAPPTPSPGMSDDDESNDSKDTSNLDH